MLGTVVHARDVLGNTAKYLWPNGAYIWNREENVNIIRKLFSMFEGYTRVVTGGLSEKLTSGQNLNEWVWSRTHVCGRSIPDTGTSQGRNLRRECAKCAQTEKARGHWTKRKSDRRWCIEETQSRSRRSLEALKELWFSHKSIIF